MHWIAKYIGLPYLSGGRDVQGVDCWGLIFLVYPQEFQIELPTLPGISAQAPLGIHRTLTEHAEQDWKELQYPVDGCVVAMSQKEAMHHVGLWANADGGKVVHSWKGDRVIADTTLKIRLKGFRKLKFYQHRLWPA